MQLCIPYLGFKVEKNLEGRIQDPNLDLNLVICMMDINYFFSEDKLKKHLNRVKGIQY